MSRAAQESTAVGLGSAALGFVMEDPNRLAEFECYLVQQTGTRLEFPSTTAWRDAVACARKMCAQVAHMLNFAEAS